MRTGTAAERAVGTSMIAGTVTIAIAVGREMIAATGTIAETIAATAAGGAAQAGRGSASGTIATAARIQYRRRLPLVSGVRPRS